VETRRPVIFTTKPRGRLAQALREAGWPVEPLEPDPVLPRSERYVLSAEVAVTRLTGATFARALTDKTLFVDAVDLRQSFAAPVVVVEGPDLAPRRQLHPHAVRGALSALVVEYRVSVLRTLDLEETAGLLVMLATHAQQGVPEISLQPKRRATDLADQQRRVVEMLPGAGLVAARRLLQTFGSIARIATATEEELRRVPGVGPGKAREMRAVLSGEYRSVDSEQEIEEAVARRPALVLGAPGEVLPRQHVFFTSEGARQVVDLVLCQPGERVAYIVELKRGPIQREHHRQLSLYLDQAHCSTLLRELTEAHWELRGVLASPASVQHEPSDPRLTVVVLDREALIEELCAWRREQAARWAGDTERPSA